MSKSVITRRYLQKDYIDKLVKRKNILADTPEVAEKRNSGAAPQISPL